MKGDFTRSTFRQDRHYRTVRMQQGRVQLDADWNEQLDIDEHLDRTETRDVIGVRGAPMDGGGFEIVGTVTNTAGDADLILSPGRLYVDGLLCELDAAPVELAAAPSGSTVQVTSLLADGTPLQAGQWVELSEGTATQIAEITAITDRTLTLSASAGAFTAAALLRRVVTYLTQPHLPTPDPFDPTRNHVAYLAVWQRHVTQVEDPDLREPALGGPDTGPDTTTRAMTVWQVRLQEIDPSEVDPDCGDFDAGWLPAGAGGTAELRARAEPDPEVDDVCLVPPEAGYRRLEHQLYRVEIHRGTNDAGLPPTFKWSRDNGSVVYPMTGVTSPTAPATVAVATLGRDDYLRIKEQDVVEVVDDAVVLDGTAGDLFRVTAIDSGNLNVTLDDGLPGQLGQDPARHPLLRRWDHRPRSGITVAADGAVEIVEDTWLPLEAGVEVQFRAGSTYHTGDHWLVPARYGVPEGVLWPTDATADGSVFAPPHGVERDYCVLAVIVGGTPQDCRPEFPPLTALTTLHYVGGDGQQGVPDPAAPTSRDVALPSPLQVRVANGSFPVAGAAVQFAVAAGNGRLQGTADTTARVETDPDGVATCTWHLDGGTPEQMCEARLLDPTDTPLDFEIVRFSATLSTAGRVAYNPEACPDLRTEGVKTVQEAIDALCGGGGGGCCCVTVGDGGDFPDIRRAIAALMERGQFDICLCLLPGDHQLPGLELIPREERRALHLRIVGCGRSTRLRLLKDVRLARLAELALRGMVIDVADGATIHVSRCSEVLIDDCVVSGLPPEVGLVRIHSADRVHVGNSTFEAFVTRDLLGDVGDLPRELFEAFQQMIEMDLYAPWTEFSEKGRNAALQLAGRNPDERRAIADELTERVKANEGHLSVGEVTAFRRFIAAIVFDEPDVSTLYDHLVAIRRNILRANAGLALEFDNFARFDNEPMMDPSFAHDGPVTIENNDVIGGLSFYGMGHRDRDADVAWLRVLLNQLRQHQARLGAADGDVHLRDNRVTRLEVSLDIIRALEELARSDRGEINVLLRTLHCTDTVIDGEGSQLVASRATLTSDAFTLSAVRPREPGGEQRVVVATVIADAAVYTGNTGESRGYGIHFMPQIVNVARAEGQAANVDLDFAF